MILIISLAVISIGLGVTAGALIPTVSDAACHSFLITVCSYLIPFEQVQIAHYSASMILQQSEMLGTLLKKLQVITNLCMHNKFFYSFVVVEP